MTIYGHMKTIINISSLKANLSSSLKKVREGGRILVMDRDVPIAEIIPYGAKPALKIRKPEKSFKIPQSDISVKPDPLDFLMEERNKR